MVGRPFWRSGSGWETLLDLRKWSESLPEVWNLSGDPSGGPKMVGTPSKSFETSQETLPEVRKWWGDPPGGPEQVGRPSRRSVSGRETLSEVQKWSGDPTEV